MEVMKKIKDWAEILCTEVESAEPRDSPLNRRSFLLFFEEYIQKTTSAQVLNIGDIEIKESLARQLFNAWFECHSVESLLKERNKISLLQYIKDKMYNGRNLDEDVKANFTSFLKHRSILYLSIETWDQFFDEFVVNDPIFRENGVFKTYPIVVYSDIDSPKTLIISPYEELSTIPGNWHFERRFEDMSTALKVTESWNHSVKDILKVEDTTENDLFDQKFLYVTWIDDLKDKTCFYANNIPNLRFNVNKNIQLGKDKLCFSGDENRPFKATFGDDFVFVYYDPDYEIKYAKKSIIADPIQQVKEKIEKLNVDSSLKEIFWDLVKLVEEK